MNKIYNIVWSESAGRWVVTSELARRGGRSRQVRCAVLAGLALCG
ncbi:TPA: hypothetical protein JZG04_004665, partial [Escherichia coli]|nr:hypothetical protein [Escherichia coli]HAX4856536.1 hypothetical protein [Escherichia coli]HAX4916595.1 hypothetical protein [Escherichia coli]HAX4925506.1 hypothetical protein [Escherichia coli]HAX4948737.1 hypothetical protein [Escherichia coli]